MIIIIIIIIIYLLILRVLHVSVLFALVKLAFVALLSGEYFKIFWGLVPGSLLLLILEL